MQRGALFVEIAGYPLGSCRNDVIRMRVVSLFGFTSTRVMTCGESPLGNNVGGVAASLLGSGLQVLANMKVTGITGSLLGSNIPDPADEWYVGSVVSLLGSTVPVIARVWALPCV